MSSEDEKDRALEALGKPDVDEVVAARIRRRGHVALARGARLAKTPGLARLDRVYNVAIEPALVGAAAVLYLAWAFVKVFG
jgi:hypothetical protein